MLQAIQLLIFHLLYTFDYYHRVRFEGCSFTVISRDLDTAWGECRTGHPAGALERLQAVAELLNDESAPLLHYRFHWITSWIQFLLGDFETGYTHSQQARVLSDDLDLVMQANAAAQNGRLLRALGLFEEGYSECLTALDLAVQSGDDWATAFALYILDIATSRGGDTDTATQYLERAMRYAHASGDMHLLCWIETNHACNLADHALDAQREGNDTAFRDGFEAAAGGSLDAANRARGISDSWAERISLANGAEFYAGIGRFEEAHRLLDRWRGVAGELNTRRLVHYQFTCASVLRDEGQLVEAQKICDRALQLVDGEKGNDLQHDFKKLLSEINEELGDYKSALALYKHYHQLLRDFEGEQVKRRARAAAIFYESEKLRKEAEEARQHAEQSARDATTDPLTGIANRRHFEREFDRVLAEDPDEIAVLYLDLDHFKRVNDDFSHAVGDLVLQAAAQVFETCCRKGDLVSRIGGEEFVLLLREGDQAAAEAASDRILDGIRSFDWSTIAQGLSITTSIGLAMSREEQNAEALLALADARLYEAKTGGRDKYVASDTPIMAPGAQPTPKHGIFEGENTSAPLGGGPTLGLA